MSPSPCGYCNVETDQGFCHEAKIGLKRNDEAKRNRNEPRPTRPKPVLPSSNAVSRDDNKDLARLGRVYLGRVTVWVDAVTALRVSGGLRRLLCARSRKYRSLPRELAGVCFRGKAAVATRDCVGKPARTYSMDCDWQESISNQGPFVESCVSLWYCIHMCTHGCCEHVQSGMMHPLLLCPIHDILLAPLVNDRDAVLLVLVLGDP